MPVYDIAAAQQTAEPVSNYYQGKAVRLALRNQELANQSLEIQNEQADDFLAMEQDKATTERDKVSLERDKLKQQIAESRQKASQEEWEAFENSSAAYATWLEENPDDVEGATQRLWETYTLQGYDPAKAAGGENVIVPPEVVGGVLAASVEDYRDLQTSIAKKSSDLSEREKKIKQYQEVFGTSLEEAIKLVDGKLKVSSTPDSRGFVTVTDTVSKQAYKIPAEEAVSLGLEPEQEVPTAPKQESNDNKTLSGQVGDVEADQPWAKPIAKIKVAPGIQSSVVTKSQDKIRSLDNALGAYAQISSSDVMEASGSAAMAKRGANALLQAITFNAAPRFAEEESLAENNVRQFNQTVRSGIVNSDRFPVWEQQMVSAMLPDPNNIFKDPEGEALKLSNVLQTIQQFRENEVSMLEGRERRIIPRSPVGIKADPIPVKSEEEAFEYPDGTYVLYEGQVFRVE